MERRTLLWGLLVGVSWLDCTGCVTSRDFASDAGVQEAEGGVAAGGLGRQQPGTARDAATAAGVESVEFTIGVARDAAVRGDAQMPVVELDATFSSGPVKRACLIDQECKDGNACNGEEQCANGYCTHGAGISNGQVCEVGADELSVCRGSNCLASRCGDGITDERRSEDCDDANATDGDGCDRNCKFTCATADDCGDGDICNGAEICDVELHVCVAGERAEDEVDCGDGYACRGGRCLSIACGDGVVDNGEECDDGNVNGGDGCDESCAYECHVVEDCDDGNVCNGVETCDVETHACLAGTALDCDDRDACTDDQCDATRGCVPVLIDEDRDGQAPSSVKGCGTDCDDGDPNVFSGAGELCDSIDNNCDGHTDEIAPTWYPDCDGDGYPPADAEGVQQCTTPDTAPGGCGRGAAAVWTARPPSEGADCWDGDPDVYPRSDAVWNDQPITGRKELAFDYNCDNLEDTRWDGAGLAKNASCSSVVILDPVLDGDLLLQQLAIAPILCSGKSGWLESEAPACGQPGTYTYCNGCTREVVEGYLQQCQ